MKIQNINCDYIRVLSSAYEKNYNVDNLQSVEIKVSVNDEDIITESVIIGDLYDTWKVSFAQDANTRINQLYLKNIFTNQLYPLLPEGSSFSIGTVNLDAIGVLIDATLAILGIVGVTQDYTIGASTVEYSFTGLPAHIIAASIYIKRTLAATESIKYFSYQDSDKYILNGNDILLLPSFFNLTTFKDGIYKFSVTVLDKQNILTKEETCYFMDCTIAGSLITNVEVDECNEADIRLLMLHYSLRIASNRHCDCEKMQNIFDFLSENIDSSNTDPCGC